MKGLDFLESAFPGLADPWAALFISSVIGVVVLFLLRCLANGLLEMHRSKTALRKLRKEYSLWDRFLLLPPWNRCEHAPKFCRTVVCIHHLRLYLLLLALLLILLGTGIEGLQEIGRILCLLSVILIDIPCALLDTLLSRRPSWRSKHREYRFKKYKNTSERMKLW